MASSDHWSTEYLRLLEDCTSRSEALNEWECGFVESLTRQIEAGRQPSPKQIDVLDRLWEKATRRG
jgi:hypothetical protein